VFLRVRVRSRSASLDWLATKVELLLRAMLRPCLVEPMNGILRLDPESLQGQNHGPHRDDRRRCWADVTAVEATNLARLILRVTMISSTIAWRRSRRPMTAAQLRSGRHDARNSSTILGNHVRPLSPLGIRPSTPLHCLANAWLGVFSRAAITIVFLVSASRRECCAK
jgi:hypothetical protein